MPQIQGRVQILDPETAEVLEFATAPQNVKTTAGAESADIRLDEFGTLSRPRGRPPTTYAWDGVLYAAARYGDPWVDSGLWRPPADIKALLEHWHDTQPRRRQPLELTVLHDRYPTILKPVYISGLDFTWAGGFGDLGYSLELTEWRSVTVGLDDQGVSTSDEVLATETGDAVDEPAIPATIVVRPGDTLWGLAQANLGDGARWEEIYGLNADAIGPDPHSLTVGTELVMPGGSQPTEEEPSQDYAGFVDESGDERAWLPPSPD